MANAFLKPERVVSTALGLLQRELTLPRLVWRDAAGDFKGAKDDTISIRVPAYAPARSRDLRSGTTRTRDELTERKVDVTLDTDIYKDVKVTDEQLSLDIADFGQQVLNPMMGGVAQALEQKVADEVTGATYHNSITYTVATDNAWSDVILVAREHLNKANVPMSGRVIALGAEAETAFLGTDLFVKANESGSGMALSEATIGRKGGFDIVSCPVLPPDEAYAFHRTAYAMNQRAPMVPAGAPWGASQSFDGLAMRAVRILDSDSIEDVVAVDSWVGTNIVTDEGFYTSGGVFLPSDGPVGAQVTLATSAAADDIIDTAAAHGYVAGDIVVFDALTGGTGLVVGQRYYVIAANLAATTFQVSLTAGGSAALFSADITAGTVRKNGAPLFVRAVKIALA